MWEIQRSIKKEMEFPGVIKKNYVEFIALEFLRSVTQFSEIPRCEALLSPEFSSVK